MIRAFDYRPELARHRSEIDAAIARVLDSGHLILGPESTAFEAEFADYVSARHAIGVASGTDALILALRVFDIGPGDEVVTVANTSVPTAAAIRAVGAVPRFVDVDPRTWLMTAETMSAALTDRTRAVIPVHLYGNPVSLSEIIPRAHALGLKVISDCAHAHGARRGEQRVGPIADVGCFSFYPTKNLGAFGDAGMCVTQDAPTAARLRTVKNYGMDADRIAQCDGINSRLDEIQAAILRVELRHLDATNRNRRELAEQYRRGLVGSPYAVQQVEPGMEPVYHQFVVRCPDRDAVIARFRRREIGYGIHYAQSLHQMPAFRPFHDGRPLLPVAEQLSREVLSLPLYPGLRPDEIDEVLSVLLAE